jgi:hypothetical protein
MASTASLSFSEASLLGFTIVLAQLPERLPPAQLRLIRPPMKTSLRKCIRPLRWRLILLARMSCARGCPYKYNSHCAPKTLALLERSFFRWARFVTWEMDCILAIL